jgi:hypothetical protein
VTCCILWIKFHTRIDSSAISEFVIVVKASTPGPNPDFDSARGLYGQSHAQLFCDFVSESLTRLWLGHGFHGQGMSDSIDVALAQLGAGDTAG